MSKKIEDYINQHRAEFDDKVPNPRIWEKIAQDLPKSQDNISHRLLWIKATQIAAIFTAILAAGIFIGIQLYKPNYRGELNYAASPELLQLQETEVYYQQVVNKKKAELSTLVTNDTLIERDLAQLDAQYLELKKELIANQYNNADVIVEAMLANYKIKIEILEKILKSKNKNNKDEIISM